MKRYDCVVSMWGKTQKWPRHYYRKDGICYRCGQEKSRYRAKKGERTWTKEERQRRHYVKNLDRIRKEKRVYAKKWRAENRKKNKLYNKRMKTNRTVQQKAMNKLNWAVESGKINKPKVCSCCGLARKLHGHHFDYSKPLDVVWLCPPCHKFTHRILNRHSQTV